MVVINVCVAFASDVHVYHAVAADLIKHVFQERDAGIKTTDAFAIQIDADTDLGFRSVAIDAGSTHIKLVFHTIVA